MKIRNGFVSNSSSSSFVVLLPENFIETIDYEKVSEGDEDFPTEDFKNILNDFMLNKVIWLEEIRTSNQDYNLDQSFLNLIEPYIIADINSGPDDGQVLIADIDKVKEILS